MSIDDMYDNPNKGGGGRGTSRIMIISRGGAGGCGETGETNTEQDYAAGFRAGAEAMREAVALDFEKSIGRIDVAGTDVGRPGDFIRALPLPEPK